MKKQQCKIVFETSQAVYKCLCKEYLKTSPTKEEWLSISKDFAWVQWMENTFVSSPLIYLEVIIKDFTVWCYLLFMIQNIVLFYMTLDNESGIPSKIRSSLVHAGIPDLIENNRLDISSPSTYKSCTFNPMPYFFVGDKIFSLKI